MGYRSFLAATVIAASLLGAGASPCKPATSAAVSLFQSETLSTVASEATSAVLVETFLTPSTEATSDALIETTSTAEGLSSTTLETSLTTMVDTTATADATTSTALIEKTPTTLAGSTTTTEAEACIETQVIINPGFDDNTNGAPWYSTGDITQDIVQSSPNSLQASFNTYSGSITVFKNAGGYGFFQQNLHNLRGTYELSYRWTINEVAPASGNVYCTLQPRIASHHFASIEIESWGIGDELKLSTDRWSTEGVDFSETLFSIRVDCMGGFNAMSFRFDDITLTKVCDDNLEPVITPTTLLETTSTTLAEAASTNSVETTTEPTTSDILTEESSTTLAASTTTTEAEACVETQVVINPGFDDDTNGDPWVFDGDIVDFNAYSAPNAMQINVVNGMSDVTISQNLYNLKGKYRLSYRFKVAGMHQGTSFTCSFRPKMGNSFIFSESTSEMTDIYREGAAEWSTPEGGVGNVELKLVTGCYGDFMALDIQFDDIKLTKVCDVDLKPKIE